MLNLRFTLLAILILAVDTLNRANAQVFIANEGAGDGFVNEYSSSGSVVASPFISTGHDTHAIAITGSDLFTADFYSGTIAEYALTNGQVLNPNFAYASGSPYGLAVANNLLYVSTYYNSTVTAFSLSSPSTVVWSHQFSREGGLGGLTVSGNQLFVADYNTVYNLNALNGTLGPYSIGLLDGVYGVAATNQNLYVTSIDGTVSEYTLAGQLENPSLVSGFIEANGIATDGTSLYVSNGSLVNIYNAASGRQTGEITTGLLQPAAIALVPEPSTWALLLSGLGLLAFWRARARQSVN